MNDVQIMKQPHQQHHKYEGKRESRRPPTKPLHCYVRVMPNSYAVNKAGG